MSVNKFKVGDIVKCVDNDCLYHGNLTVGKEYKVLQNNSDGTVMIENDDSVRAYYYLSRFELSNGDNSTQPPKFKEGDMVYLIGFNCLKPHKLLAKVYNYSPMKFKVEVANDVFEAFTEHGYYTTLDITPSIVLATEYNRKMLNKLLGVEYEPVKLKGSDLARKLLKDKSQTCWVSDVSDNDALSNGCVLLIVEFGDGGFTTTSGLCKKYAVPCDQHGNVLEDE